MQLFRLGLIFIPTIDPRTCGNKLQQISGRFRDQANDSRAGAQKGKGQQYGVWMILGTHPPSQLADQGCRLHPEKFFFGINSVSCFSYFREIYPSDNMICHLGRFEISCFRGWGAEERKSIYTPSPSVGIGRYTKTSADYMGVRMRRFVSSLRSRQFIYWLVDERLRIDDSGQLRASGIISGWMSLTIYV